LFEQPAARGGVRLTAFRGGVLPVGLGGPDTKTAKGIIIDW
jgi:hypothetical protein